MKPKRNLPGLASFAPIAAILSMTVSQTAQAQATWNGSVDQDWNNGANWSPNPPTGNFTVNTATGNYPILSAPPAFTPVDLFVGTGAANTGRLDHTAGSLQTAVIGAAGNWIFIGHTGGTGTYNIADTSASGGALTGFGQGSGSLTTGKLWIGGHNNAAGTGTVNINTSGTVNLQSTGTYSNHGGVSLIVGTAGGNGTLNIDNGTVNATGIVDVASAFSAAQATQGTLNIGAGGTLNSENNLRTAFAGSAGAQGNINLSGGTINVGTTVKRQIQLGNFDNGSSTITVNSGNLNLNANTDIKFKTAGGAGNHIINLNNGAITSFSGNQTGLGAGVVDLKSVDSTANTTFNLNGGTLAVRQVMSTNKANNGSATFNFHGGTLRATGDTANFVSLGAANQRAFVKSGGAIIDSNNFNVTVTEALLTDLVSLGGGLTKQGAGTLTLTAANTYTGKTTIAGGTLALGATGSIAASSEIALNGGNFNVSAVTGYTVGASQSLTGAGTVIGDITVNGTLAIGSSPGTMVFDNNLTLGSTTVSNFEFTVGTFTLGSFDLALGGDGVQTATFNGVLNLFFDSGETYVDGSTVQIFDFENYDGDFTEVNFSGLQAHQSATFDAETGIVTVIPEPGIALLSGLGVLGLLRRRRH